MLQNIIKLFAKKYVFATMGVLGIALTVASLQAEEATTKPTTKIAANASPTIPATEGITVDWTRPKDDELKKVLTPLQYNVVRQNGTESPFSNTYWNNKQQGIYVDIVSGEALFSSKDKFKSGTGWPSFTKPLQSGNIKEKSDKALFMERIEVRSTYADSHLGHVFNDGPGENGLRYCINSASLRFIPVSDLKKEGYEKYIPVFTK